MRILIVGGSGDVGEHLAKDFSNQGQDVTILDRAEIATEMKERPRVRFLKGDITDKTFVTEAVRNQEVVLHLAWSFSDNAQTIFEEDIKGHLHLLEAASAKGIRRFIYASTATVYGKAVVHPVTEDHPCLLMESRKPSYALGKYAAEELCRLYHRERNLPATIFRFWWAFGEKIGGRHLRDLIKKAMNHQTIEMVQGAGGTFLTMSDLGRAIGCAIGNPAASGQVYNVGSLFLTWEEIGARIIDLTRSTSSIHLIHSDQWKGPAFLNEVWDLSWEKAKREIGFDPLESPEQMQLLFSQALRDCIAQVKKEEK